MGVAVAWPRDSFSATASRVERAADVRLRPLGHATSSVSPSGGINGILATLRRSIWGGTAAANGTSSSSSSSIAVPPHDSAPPVPAPGPDTYVDATTGAVREAEPWMAPAPSADPWPEARARENQVLSVRLRPADARLPAFCVSVYHMPCVFWHAAFMRVHGALAARAAADFASGAPFALCGDFNVTPDSSLYALLTRGEGSLPPGEGMLSPWRPDLPKLRSALAEASGGREPPATTRTTRHADVAAGRADFCATLDYVFVSPAWEVAGATPPPPELSRMPSATEPSDHALVAATLQLLEAAGP